MKFRNAVIVDGVRSSFSWGGRACLRHRLDKGAAKVAALMERNPKVKPTMIEDFGIGNAGGTQDLVILGGISRLAGLGRNHQLSLQPPVRLFHGNHAANRHGHYGRGHGLRNFAGGGASGRTIGGGRPKGPPPTRVTSINPNIFVKSKLQRDMAEDHFNYFSVPVPDEILDSPPLQPMVQTAQNVVECSIYPGKNWMPLPSEVIKNWRRPMPRGFTKTK